MVVKIHAVEGEQISGIVCANSHIFVIKCAKDNPSAVELVSKIDLSNLNFLIASVNQQKSKGDAEHKLTILSSDVSADKRLLVVATTTKHIILFELTSFLNCGDGICIHEEAKWRTIHKTPTSVHFSACGEALLVSTRSGSLTQYRIIDANFSADNAVELLSHFSMLLDHCLSPGKPKFLLSADRDEKIRVSRYPNTQIIECFCLGHDSFVSSVCCLDDEIAVSGGGDGVLRLWQFKVGKCLCVSPKLNNSPIRKIFPFTKNNKIFVLFDNSSEISLFNFDSRGPSVEFSRTFVGDGHLFDFAIDGKSNRIFAVGRKGLFHCEIDANSAESIGMEMIDLGGEKVPLLMTELANATEVFPLEQLYKTVTFGNLENYQQKKEERKRRKRTGTELADDEKGEKKTGEDGD